MGWKTKKKIPRRHAPTDGSLEKMGLLQNRDHAMEKQWKSTALVVGGCYILVSDCEKIIKATLPSIKIAVANALAKDNIKQDKIAASLGVSQAAVNKYIKGKYSATLKKIVAQIKDSPEIRELVHYVEAGKCTSDISKKIDVFASKRIRVAIASLKEPPCF